MQPHQEDDTQEGRGDGEEQWLQEDDWDQDEEEEEVRGMGGDSGKTMPPQTAGERTLYEFFDILLLITFPRRQR